jgi:hypothetical protein
LPLASALISIRPYKPPPKLRQSLGGDDAMPVTMVIVLRERHFDRELQETAAPSFDDLIGTKQYRCWNIDTKRFCRPEVDKKLNLFGLLDDWEFSRFGTLEHLARIHTYLPQGVT